MDHKHTGAGPSTTLAGAQPIPERDISKPAEQQGMFHKFDVRRVDGSDQRGGKHCSCRYFVLDLTHDQHAPAAMRAYATACAATHPQLAADIAAEFGVRPVAQAEDMPNDVRLVLDEVARATRKFPTWPTDPLHAVAVLGEEFGELTKAVLQTTYEPHKVGDGELRTEAIQTAAMALRFVASLGRYEFTCCAQHEQVAMAAKQDQAQEHNESAGGI